MHRLYKLSVETEKNLQRPVLIPNILLDLE